MKVEEHFELMARNKAEVDYQDNPEAFLKGETNLYSKDVDPYMFEAYESVRSRIIHELRNAK